MLSVRESRRFTGDAPVSVKAWAAQLERRPFPISLRELASVELREFNGQISAGDVECSYRVTLYNSGNWYITADFKDTGTLVGDFFVLDFLVKDHRGIRIDHGNEALGVDATFHVDDRGLDPFLREHWREIRDQPLTAKLSASPDVAGIISVIGSVFVAIGTAIFFFFGGKVEGRSCPDQPGDEHRPCYEFRHVGEGPGDTVGDAGGTG
jgi:hypothetical protein